MSFINTWNVAGAFVWPKGMNKHSEPLVRAERRLVDILGRHEHLVIPGMKVKLGEVLGTTELI
jgi:hypothetical protein